MRDVQKVEVVSGRAYADVGIVVTALLAAAVWTMWIYGDRIVSGQQETNRLLGQIAEQHASESTPEEVQK